MNFDYLNKMINYIEDNLENDIDLNKLSKITNTNLFILERIFSFLTNMTLTEYIRKRRLSKAFEDIRNTNEKIIDIAIKYQFNSAPSFNRAFKQLFNISPMECRKGIGDYKIIPIEYFETNNKKYNFDYKIEKLDATVIYCYHITANNHQDLLYNIRELYRNVKKTHYYKEFNESGMYGIYSYENNIYNYYLGSKKYFGELEQYKINEGNFIVFKLKSREQKDIIDLDKRIKKQLIPSTNYEIKNNMEIEYYKEDFCYIYLEVE